MALFLLIVFIGASLAFSLRAWMHYDEDPYKTNKTDSQELGDKGDGPLTAVLVVVTLVSSASSELLQHSLGLSFIQAGAISVAILVLGQSLAFRFLARRSGGEGGVSPPSSPKP